MSVPEPKVRSGPGDGTHAFSAGERLEELRRLLTGVSRAEYLELVQQVESWQAKAEDVSSVLPQAIIEEAARGDRLSRALQPTVEGAIQASVQRNPQPLVDAIFPIIGPAIRKSVSAALRGMTENMNQLIEQSLSARALSWRVEAWRTGRPFSEVLLLKTLVYRVERALFLHTETGLCVAQATAKGGVVLDGDTLSGMLMAIQEYVQQSFADRERSEPGGEEGGLHTMTVGEHTVWIERGPYAVLAVIVRGSPPVELRETLRTKVEAVHSLGGDHLRDYCGDPDPLLDGLSTYAEDCLQARYTSESKKKRKGIGVIPSFFLFGVILLPVFFLFRQAGRNARWNELLSALESTPGIVVTKSKTDGPLLEIEGLRDPRAEDPDALVSSVEYPPENVSMTWRPFHSLEPDFVLDRVRSVLEPPDTVQLALEGETLKLTGTSDAAWEARAREMGRYVPGISRVLSQVEVSP